MKERSTAFGSIKTPSANPPPKTLGVFLHPYSSKQVTLLRVQINVMIGPIVILSSIWPLIYYPIYLSS